MESSNSYREAGVDTGEGQRFVSLIKSAVESTYHKHVMKSHGGFAGLMDASFLKEYKHPVIISSTDGVGTKLHLARLFDQHQSVGIDLVAMCSNDILVTGAKPALFLDYIACGKLNSSRMVHIVESIAEGCRRCGAALMGGETAEHPGTMKSDDYDLAGFMVGVGEKDRMLSKESVKDGDAVLSLPSSGVHSNGVSLIRKLFLTSDGLLSPQQEDNEFLLKEILLRPTIIYEPVVRPLLDSDTPLHALAHITGGGFFENIPRVLPENLKVKIDRNRMQIPSLFERIRSKGKIEEREMFSVFNMGTGMIMILPQAHAGSTLEKLKVLFENNLHADDKPTTSPVRIGTVVQRLSAEPQVEFE